MQASRQDRFGRSDDTSRHSSQALILVAVAVILGAAAWLLAPDPAPEPSQAQGTQPTPASDGIAAARPPQPMPGDAVAAAPDIPTRVIADPSASDELQPAEEEEQDVPAAAEPEVVPEPTVEDIDAQLRDALVNAGAGANTALGSAVSAPFLLDRGVSAIDQLARGYVPMRALNLPRPQGRFAVRREGLDHYVDSAGYQRYDPLVKAVTALSPEALADAFHGFRPLLVKSYASLGYPGDAVDNALIAALDALLDTPAIEGPIALRSKGALWAYADPAVEGRSDLQKQLLRMGPENLATLQEWAGRLRSALLP